MNKLERLEEIKRQIEILIKEERTSKLVNPKRDDSRVKWPPASHASWG